MYHSEVLIGFFYFPFTVEMVENLNVKRLGYRLVLCLGGGQILLILPSIHTVLFYTSLPENVPVWFHVF